MVIKSLSFDQDEILQWIIQLYCPEGFELDPTYSTGVYYQGRVPVPKLRFDLRPTSKYVNKADCRHLPLPDQSIGSINFDPPFTIGRRTSDGIIEGESIIPRRFDSFYNLADCWNMYYDSLREFYRILKPHGVLVFKCQDTVSSCKQCLSHYQILRMALQMGFYPVDLFILGNRNRIISSKHKNQQHARKFHSYFIVFKKEECPVPYFDIDTMKRWKCPTSFKSNKKKV
jgi:hypothetical protein